MWRPWGSMLLAQRWEDGVLCSPPAREALQNIVDWGLVDTFRQHYRSDEGCFSWWDYRRNGFAYGNGLRIDMVYALNAWLRSAPGPLLIAKSGAGKSRRITHR